METEGALAEVAVRGRSASSRRAATPEDLPDQWQRVVDEAVVTAAQAAEGSKMAVEVLSAFVGDDAFEDRLEEVKLLLESRIAASPELAGVKAGGGRPGRVTARIPRLEHGLDWS